MAADQLGPEFLIYAFALPPSGARVISRVDTGSVDIRQSASVLFQAFIQKMLLSYFELRKTSRKRKITLQVF